MVKRNCLILVLFIILFLNATLYSGDKPFQWHTGEQLTYKVKWAFVRLGTVQLSIEDSLKLDSIPVHKVTFRIDSNPLLFFVDVHSVFTCYIDDQIRPVYYIASERNFQKRQKAIYRFYYPDSFFTIDFMDQKDTTRYRRVTLPLKETVFDGISLIFHARSRIAKVSKDTVTSFLNDKLGKVYLNYHGADSLIHVSAIPRPVPSYYIDGVINMKGIAGVTGPFKGWFARDAQRPPLKAYLKVFVGNVIAELESWKKWQPPRE